ncbi:hypothetical protein NW762_006876 [Fusarium torreyae]|uniref:Uncharacterized protein n=1 Tax=Fusarium torreyae TaxID=1237075 RepID=A0A9W8S0X0_9HYPO|nr:hypothetical protein NW762_006876 [Fusarium torreyae]
MSACHGRSIARAKNEAQLIDSARKLIQEFRDSRSELDDDFPHLVDTSDLLDEIDKSIALVRQEDTLQTATVIREVKQNIKRMGYINQEGARAVRVRKRDMAKRGATDYPNRYKNTFRPMPKWLIERRDLLNKCVLCAQVGLTGNTKDGFEIHRDVLLEMSAKVKAVIGLDLVLVTWLQNAYDGPLQFDKAFERELAELQDQKQNTPECNPEQAKSDDAEEDWVFDNVTRNQAHAMAGDPGVQAWTEAAKTPPRRGCR